MADTVFFSWQSDRPAKVTRTVIRAAIESAIKNLNAGLEEADRPSDERLEIDHDTKGLPGTPDIAASILIKIEAATIFVADVTPIGMSESYPTKRQKHLSNPNVLIELGYAKKALTTDRIVQVWNTAFTECGPDDLPFDMRGKRGPIAFELPLEATKVERERATVILAKAIGDAFGPILNLRQPAPTSPPKWAPSAENDRSIWPTKNGEIIVNEPDHGSGIKRIQNSPRSFVRVLPNRWSGTDDLDRHDFLIDGMGLTWGATQGGVATYPGSILFDDTVDVHAFTKRFAETGEVWATRTDIARDREGRRYVYGDNVPQGWAKYLASTIPHVEKGGGELPFHIQLGVVGLENTYWPTETTFAAQPHAALEPDLILSYQLKRTDADSLWDIVKDAWVKYRRIFSIPEPQMPSMQQMKHFITRSMG